MERGGEIGRKERGRGEGEGEGRESSKSLHKQLVNGVIGAQTIANWSCEFRQSQST